MLMLLRRRCRAWLEIRRLDKELAQSSGLPLELPQIVPNAWNEVVWRLPVPNHPDAFMTASNAAQSDFIVYVNGLAFYRAWLALGVEDSQACPLKQDMPKDRKYPSSAAHFAVGIDSPVPLADVSPTMILGHFAVCFTDGMTRSMWLLAHEVAVFPVLSRDEASAVMLAEHVGVAAPIQVSKLREQCRKIHQATTGCCRPSADAGRTFRNRPFDAAPMAFAQG